MGPETETKCAACSKPATMWCSGCKGAPEYEPGDAAETVYCDRDCQKQHWAGHKTRCRMLQQRRKLLRAAKLLKAALLTYRGVHYDIDLTKIELKDDTLWLHQIPRARRKRGPFPEHLTDNIEQREAALTVNQCTTAMALLGRLTRKLLRTTCVMFEVVDLHLGKRPLPTQLCPAPDSSNAPHTVIRAVRLQSKEAWVIDTTGCQYGLRDVLVPFDKYVSEKQCRAAGQPRTYHDSEMTDLDYFATIPFMVRTKAQRDGMEQERKDRLRFAAFVDTVGVDILDGSGEAFEEKKGRFVEELRAHLLKR